MVQLAEGVTYKLKKLFVILANLLASFIKHICTNLLTEMLTQIKAENSCNLPDSTISRIVGGKVITVIFVVSNSPRISPNHWILVSNK